MKKILALALALSLCATLAACGGKEPDTPAPAEPAPAESAPAAAEPEPADAGGPTDEQIEALTDAYNQVVEAYNEAADTAVENGWTVDLDVQADLDAVADAMSPIGDALNALNAGDLSALEGEDFDALTSKLLDYVSLSHSMTEKFSVPYEDETEDESGSEAAAASGEALDVTDESLKPLVEEYNNIAPLYNEVYETAEANGWLEDETTAAELQGLTGLLSYIGAGLEDTSMLEDTDLDALVEQMETEIVPAIEMLSERVSEPYGG